MSCGWPAQIFASRRGGCRIPTPRFRCWQEAVADAQAGSQLLGGSKSHRFNGRYGSFRFDERHKITRIYAGFPRFRAKIRDPDIKSDQLAILDVHACYRIKTCHFCFSVILETVESSKNLGPGSHRGPIFFWKRSTRIPVLESFEIGREAGPSF